ncbi:MAG: 16S rRNA (uracil(1498)-N(3))-methyltransferase [Bacteroidetes bacterium]|nr:MAG: 16S rRNA (uracil(1498)-N(3))-methyltransferase [Bacteroidota bacterium]
MHIFYCPDISENPFLSEKESRHATKVLRLKNGEKINLIDGNGGFYTVKIIDENSKKCKVKILEKRRNYGKRNYYLHIAIAPTKNISRFEWFLEKATEIGIDEITPIICQHSERKTLKTERLEKILISAMKQSQQAFLPRLNPIVSFNELINKSVNQQKLIAICAGEGKSQHLKNLYKKENDAVICIGAEGGFSKDEIEASVDKGYAPVSLGSNRLRTETAGFTACHAISLINQ